MVSAQDDHPPTRQIHPARPAAGEGAGRHRRGRTSGIWRRARRGDCGDAPAERGAEQRPLGRSSGHGARRAARHGDGVRVAGRHGPSRIMLTETAPKHGHRIIWVPFLDPRGRTFHQRIEDNGGIPGVYVGVEPAEGTWVAVKITGHDVAERPVWSSGERERWNASLNRPGQPERTVLTAFGVRWSYIELAACLERHAATTACSGCGS